MAGLKSELITWSPTFSVGVKLIDDQHRGLLDLVNHLFNHVVGDEEAERDFFQEVIQEAVKYVRVHFATEEKIMIATKFPGYPEHKKAHDTFVLTVVNNIKDFEDGKKFSLAAITKFLKEWILTHIAIVDKEYFNYFKNIASRKADGRLGISSENIS